MSEGSWATNRQQLRGEGWWEHEVGISSGHRKKRPNEKENWEDRSTWEGGGDSKGEGPLRELGVQEEEWVCGPLGLLGS